MYEISLRITADVRTARDELRRFRQDIANAVSAGVGDTVKAQTNTALVRVNQTLAQQARVLRQAALAWANYVRVMGTAQQAAARIASQGMRMLSGPGVPALLRSSAVGSARMSGPGGSRTIDAEWWYSKSATSGPEAGLNRIHAALRRVGREKDRLAQNFIWFGVVMRSVFNGGTTNIINFERASRDATGRSAGHFGFFGNFVRGIFFRLRWLIQMTFAGALLFGPIAFVNASIKKFLEFERAISQALLRVPNKFRGMWGELANTAFDISRKLGTSVMKTAESLRFSLGAGFKTIKEASEISRAASKLSVASMSDFGQSTAAITNILEGFGLKSHEAARAADVLFVGMQQGTLDMHDMEQGMEKLSPIFHQTGATMEDMIATTALLSRSAQGEMTVFTELAQVTQRLVAPSDSSRAAMQALGVQLVKNRQGGIDWLMTITKMGERMRQLSGGDQQRMARLLGMVVPGGQGGRSQRALLRLFGGDPADIRAVRDAVYNATGAVNRGLDDVNVRAFRTWDRFKATAERTFISVGLAIMRALEPAVKAFEQFMRKFEVGQPGFEEFQAHVEIFVGSFIEGMGEIVQALSVISGFLITIERQLIRLVKYKDMMRFQFAATPFPGIGPLVGAGMSLIPKQAGGLVPGVGTGDRVPIMAEAGEVVLPRSVVGSLRHLFNMPGRSGGMQTGGSVPAGGTFSDKLKVIADILGDIRDIAKAVPERIGREVDKSMAQRFPGYGLGAGLKDAGREIRERGQSRLGELRGRGPAVKQPPIERTSAAELYRGLSAPQRARAARSGAFETTEWNPETRRHEIRRVSMADVHGAARQERIAGATKRADERRDRIRQYADSDRLRRKGVASSAERLPGERKAIGRDAEGRAIVGTDEFGKPITRALDFVGPMQGPPALAGMDTGLPKGAISPKGGGYIIGPSGEKILMPRGKSRMAPEAGSMSISGPGGAMFRGPRQLGGKPLREQGMFISGPAGEMTRSSAGTFRGDVSVGRTVPPFGITPGTGATPGLMGRQPGIDGASTGGGRYKRMPWEPGYSVVPDVIHAPRRAQDEGAFFEPTNPRYVPNMDERSRARPPRAGSAPFNRQTSSGSSGSSALGLASEINAMAGKSGDGEVLAMIVRELESAKKKIVRLDDKISVLTSGIA